MAVCRSCVQRAESRAKREEEGELRRCQAKQDKLFVALFCLLIFCFSLKYSLVIWPKSWCSFCRLMVDAKHS